MLDCFLSVDPYSGAYRFNIGNFKNRGDRRDYSLGRIIYIRDPPLVFVPIMLEIASRLCLSNDLRVVRLGTDTLPLASALSIKNKFV